MADMIKVDAALEARMKLWARHADDYPEVIKRLTDECERLKRTLYDHTKERGVNSIDAFSYVCRVQRGDA